MATWVGAKFAADRVQAVAGCVNVQWYGAQGDNNPVTGPANDVAFAAARTAADLTDRGLYIPGGVYYFSNNAWLNVPLTRVGMEIGGDSGKTTLRYTGADTKIIYMDGGAAATVGAGLNSCYIHDLLLIGAAGATTSYGVLARNFHQNRIINVEVRDVTQAALRMETCAQNEVDNFACTVNRVFFALQPAYGIYLTQRIGGVDPPGFTCTMNEFRNCPMEGLAAGIGIYLDNAVDNMFLDCQPEGNLGGIFLTANAIGNVFIRAEMVSNTGYDIDCTGIANVFQGCQSANAVTWQIAARSNVLRDGVYAGVITNLSALAQLFDGPNLTIAAVGALNDNISPGRFWSNVDNTWHHRIPGLLVFADNAAALAGGLTAGDLYRTAVGAVMVVV